MKKAPFVVVFSFLSATVFSQTVAFVNKVPVNAKEFMWVYKKNNQGNAMATFDELHAYLELYINFKLKVLDAKALKLDQDTAYLNEIKNYEQIIKTNTRARSKEELQYILNEYRDGVLMFNVSEKKIWFPRRSDAGGAMTEEEQHTLEDDWIKQLRTKYQVKIDDEVLKKLARP